MHHVLISNGHLFIPPEFLSTSHYVMRYNKRHAIESYVILSDCMFHVIGSYFILLDRTSFYRTIYFRSLDRTSFYWIRRHSIGLHTSCHWIGRHFTGSCLIPSDYISCHWIRNVIRSGQELFDEKSNYVLGKHRTTQAQLITSNIKRYFLML